VPDTRRKAQSSKAPQPVPVEFRQLFVQHGWSRVNHLFGKRASVRYFTALGADRLRAERDAYRSERKPGLVRHGRDHVRHTSQGLGA
jgi:hypothetical protein